MPSSLLGLPNEVLHEIFACLGPQDLEAIAMTGRAARDHLCTRTRTLPTDRAFSRPLSVQRLAKREYNNVFVLLVRQHLSYLEFRPSAFQHLCAVSLPTTRMFLRCLHMTGDTDAVNMSSGTNNLHPPSS